MKDMELLHKLEDIVTEELKRVAKPQNGSISKLQFAS